jgi:hypothetical protein
MAQVQAQQAERERLEDELRQFVFELEGGLDRLQEYKIRAPLGVATVTGTVDALLDGVGVQPSTFQQFVDKDRVKALRQRLSAMREEELASLSQSEQEQLGRIIPVSAHREDLQNLIVALKAKEELGKTEEQWNRLQTEKKEMLGSWNGVLVVSAVLGAMFFCAGASMTSSSSSIVGEGGGAVLCLSGIAGIAFLFALLKIISTAPEGYKMLEQARAALRSKLLKHEKYLEITKIFGEGIPIEEYEKKAAEIADYMSRALEHDKDGNPLPESLIRVALPARLLQAKEK